MASGKSLGEVAQRMTAPRPNLQDVTPCVQTRQRIRRLWQRGGDEDHHIGFSEILEGFDPPRIMLAPRPDPARLERAGEGAEVLVESREELDAAPHELGVSGIKEERVHVRRQAIACVLIPVEDLEGIGGPAPDADIPGLVPELREDGIFNACITGRRNRPEEVCLESNVNDPGGLVAQYVVEERVPLALLRDCLRHGDVSAVVAGCTYSAWVPPERAILPRTFRVSGSAAPNGMAEATTSSTAC